MTLYTVSQKNADHQVCHSFIKYWLIFKILSPSHSRKPVIKASLKIPPHLKHVATLPCEICFRKPAERCNFSQHLYFTFLHYSAGFLSNAVFRNIYISQFCITQLVFWFLRCKECVGDRILKIGQYLVKLWYNLSGYVLFWLAVYMPVWRQFCLWILFVFMCLTCYLCVCVCVSVLVSVINKYLWFVSGVKRYVLATSRFLTLQTEYFFYKIMWFCEFPPFLVDLHDLQSF